MGMARRLVIMRHAKAEQPDGVDDVDRPLTDRGHADSGAAGAWLADSDYVPDLVLCSPAKRTRQTWHGVAIALVNDGGFSSPSVRYEPALYDGNAMDLLEVVHQTDPAVETILLIGHNPAVSSLSALLDPEADQDFDGLRTAGIAVYEREGGEWVDFEPDSTPLAATHTARS